MSEDEAQFIGKQEHWDILSDVCEDEDIDDADFLDTLMRRLEVEDE